MRVFIVSSKSGSTIEVTSLERHFWSVVAAAVAEPGRHFVAITDAGTRTRHARGELAVTVTRSSTRPTSADATPRSRSSVSCPPRSSASRPADLLDPAQTMADECRQDDGTNPGLSAGRVPRGACERRTRQDDHSRAGRARAARRVDRAARRREHRQDWARASCRSSPSPSVAAADYGDDRAFVALLTPDAHDVREAAVALEAAGHPVFRIETSAAALGAEFFRWEFATAVAGAVLARIRSTNPTCAERRCARRPSSTRSAPPARSASIRPSSKGPATHAANGCRSRPRRAGRISRSSTICRHKTDARRSSPPALGPSSAGPHVRPPTASARATCTRPGIPQGRSEYGHLPVADRCRRTGHAGSRHELLVQHAEACTGVRRFRRASRCRAAGVCTITSKTHPPPHHTTAHSERIVAELPVPPSLIEDADRDDSITVLTLVWLSVTPAGLSQQRPASGRLFPPADLGVLEASDRDGVAAAGSRDGRAWHCRWLAGGGSRAGGGLVRDVVWPRASAPTARSTRRISSRR